MEFFVKFSLILSRLELLKEEFTKLTQAFLWGILALPFVLADQFCFHMPQPIRLEFLKSLSLS